MKTAYCPALFFAAPASGQGKTTITAAFARLLRRQGKRVVVFKTGPDYLDPKILAQASGVAVASLDMWMSGESWCQQKLFEAALSADIILVEGVMGMFDGRPSSADLAARFNIPMAIVMDVKGMAQTAAAIAVGLANFRNDFTTLGLIANNCSTERHRELIASSLPASLPLLATLKKSSKVALPERHLGLVQAEEHFEMLDQRLEAGADWLTEAGVLQWAYKLKPVAFNASTYERPEELLRGKTIAVARDAAFSFIYDENIQLLTDMGASIRYFSPLNDSAIPQADALWLAGGYPELHAKTLSSNIEMLQALRECHQQNIPILAECGGFLYCLASLTDLNEAKYPMAGLMPGHGVMRGKRGCQGMQSAPLPEGLVRGHAHHRSRSEGTPEPMAFGVRQHHRANGEAIYRVGSLTASYLHLFFPSNPRAIAALFNRNLSNAMGDVQPAVTTNSCDEQYSIDGVENDH